MIGFLCLDDARGVCFNGRLPSTDRTVSTRMLTLCEPHSLWCRPAAARAFDDLSPANFCVDDAPLEKAAPDDGVFFDGPPDKETLAQLNELVIFWWHRRYPADGYFHLDPAAIGFQLVDTQEYVGHSHENITEERYRR